MSCDFYALATPGIRGLSPYEPGKPIEELERELGLDGIIKLASNESPLGPGRRVQSVLRAAIGSLGRYPDGNGFALKSALAERLDVVPACLTLGNGSNDILEFIARAFVSDTHEVVFSEHAFAVYPLVTQAVGARAVVVPAEHFGHDLAAMAAAITDATRVVFIANPNNPTGTCSAAVEVREFIAGVPRHVLVVLDEAYYDYVEVEGYASAIGWIDAFPNVIVTRTFSKAYGLAGLRVGYGVSHPQVADLLNRVRQPFNVNSLGLAAARAALEDVTHLSESVAVNRRGMAQICNGLEVLGIDYIPSVANFVCVHTARPGGEVFQQLLRAGVIVRPVASYGLPNHIRVTIGLEEENDRFLSSLKKALS